MVRQLERLSATARSLIEQEELSISPIVAVELSFLHELGRLTVDAGEIVGYLGAMIGLLQDDAAFAAVVALSSRFDWTRDPFDRIIVAQAQLREARLITKDQSLLQRFPLAVW
ncbi:MAG TPA: PIN domain-containing protein [Spirochaetia bacterium]|nr:PIN domain-containing protein [Spirochaetia bacterium]